MTKFKLYEKLDTIYHTVRVFRFHLLPLRWACDRYDEMLKDADDLDYYGLEKWDDVPDPYALRCGVCEGIDYPGLTHNTDSPECSLYRSPEQKREDEERFYRAGGCRKCGAPPGTPCDAALHS